MAQDLYGLLGVSKTASDAELKKAYRVLARKYHPDINKEPGADKKFKEVQQAYDVLSDSNKRARYDQFGVVDDQPGADSGFGGFGGFGGASGFSGIDDIFDAFFGGGQGRSRRSGDVPGEDLRVDVSLSLEEAAAGLKKSVSIQYVDIKAGSKKTCRHCQGTGFVEMTQRTILGSVIQRGACPQCGGVGTSFEKERKSKTIDIDIPAGVDNGMKLRISGEGNAGSSSRGDLYVYITVKKHQYFVRENDDIFLNYRLPVSQAILGVKVSIPTLHGETQLSIPPGTESHSILRLKGKGVPRLQGYGRGDMKVKIILEIPKSLSRDEKKLIEEFASKRRDSEKLEKHSYS